MEWSKQQTAIFNWFENGTGNLVIRARAGTGKTTSIIQGISGAPENKILLAAFNKKIATELQSRVKHPGAEAKTLHSLGFAYVRRQWAGIRIDDERGGRLAEAACGGQAAPPEMTSTVRKLAALGKNAAPDARTRDLEDLAIEHDLTPDPEWEEDGWTLERVIRCTQTAMRAALQPDGTIDFDDMVYVPVANRWVRGWYDLVVIDEAQDMNASQLRLALGACKKGGRIAVVGDDRQAIYGFRGADSGSIDRLKTELKATELALTITRRCPKSVVALAAVLVPDFEAAPVAPDGTIDSLNMEALGAAANVGDFILSRKNAPLVSTCLKILRTGKRARVEGKDVGKGLVALIKKVSKGKARNDMAEMMARLTKWEEREVAKWNAAGKQAKATEAADKAETLRALAEGLTTVPEMVTRIETLFTDDAAKQACVVLSSIHRSKGLEADRVFILKDTLYPGGRTEDIEEKNLEYVAITRSKRHLTWVIDPKAPAAKPEVKA